jgi:hypothetical protein
VESGNAYDAEIDGVQQAEEHARKIVKSYVCLDERCEFQTNSWNRAIVHHHDTDHSLVERK